MAGGNQKIISDAANWPPLNGRSLAGYQQKRVWVNDGAGDFREVAQVVGVTDVFDGRSIAFADFENRGVLDAVVANQNGPLLVLQKHRGSGKQLDRVRIAGEPANRSAIGANVTVFWKGQRAGSGSFRRQRFLRTESETSAFRARQSRCGGARGNPLAIGQDANRRRSRAQSNS